SFFGENVDLPTTAARMIRRIAGVEEVAATENVTATVRRSNLIDADETSGIAVVAADVTLLRTLGGSVAQGRWLDGASSRYPTVVLGSVAAERLGIERWHPGLQVWLD